MKWTSRFANYTLHDFRRDAIAGLIVGIIAIPLGMAFAIAAGVNPQYGIYTTIIAGFLISLLGGSRFQIGGPTGAFVPILLAVVLQYGYENLLIAGMLAGLILVIMGVCRDLLVDLTTAVQIGLLLAAILFVKRMSELLTVSKVLPDSASGNGKVAAHNVREGHDCPQIAIYTVEGALFFGAVALFEKSVMRSIHDRPGILLLRLGRVPFLDTTGESTLSSVVKDVHRQGGIVLISGIQPQPREVLRRTGLDRKIGADRFFAHTGEAIRYAIERLNRQKCMVCKHFAFRECDGLSRGESIEGVGAIDGMDSIGGISDGNGIRSGVNGQARPGLRASHGCDSAQ